MFNANMTRAETERLLTSIRAYVEVDPTSDDCDAEDLLARTRGYAAAATDDHQMADIGGEG